MFGGVRRSALEALLAATLLAVPFGMVSACANEQGNRETFCAQARRVPVITERDDLTVPDTATATGQLVTELRRLREAAPAEIRGDVSVLVGVAEDLQTALSNGDEASVEAAKQRMAASGEAWKAASDNVVIYAATACGIDLGT